MKSMPHSRNASRLIALIILALTSNVQAIAQTEPKLLWAKSLIGSNDVNARSIKRDSDSNLYITGYFIGIVDFDPGPGSAFLTSSGGGDIFIAKYDPSGAHIWSKHIGGLGNDVSVGLAINNYDELYITGRFQGAVDFDPGPGIHNHTSAGGEDVFLAKFNNHGQLLWASSMGGPSNETGNSIAVSASDMVYLTGKFSATVDFDPGPGTANLTSSGAEDVFLAKYDGAGIHVWSGRMGGPSLEEGYALAVDNAEDVIITGHFLSTADFDPGPGTANLISAGGYDMFLAKYDRLGNHVWSKRMGGTAGEEPRSLILDASGNIHVTGQYYGNGDYDPGPGSSILVNHGASDIFLCKYDVNGNHLWSLGIGAQNNDYGMSVATDREGNAYMTGYFMGQVDFDAGPDTAYLSSFGLNDVFMAKYDATGNHVWSKHIGGVLNDECLSILVDDRRNIFLAGYFRGTADFDPGPVSQTLTGSIYVWSSFIAAYSTATSKTWIGGDGDWSNPANWSDGEVPGIYDLITISSGNARLDTDFQAAGTLILSGTGALTVQPGKTLTVSGTADFGSRPVVFQSDASGTAQLGTVSGSLSGASLVTVERYIPNTGRRWRLLTAPVTGVTVNSAWQNGQTWNGLNPLPGDNTATLITGQQQGTTETANSRGFDFWPAISNGSASVMSYTQRTGQGVWSPLPNTTTADAFGNDQAYLLFLRGPRSSAFSSGSANAATTLKPTGALKQGVRNITIDGTKGYTLIGNPYPSQIDFDAIYLTDGNRYVIKRQFWMWDATAGISGNFIAVVYSGDRYVEVPAKFHGAGQASPLTAIQSGHGFFVIPLTTSGANLRIQETHKLSLQPASPNILLSDDRTPRVWLNLVKKSSDGSSLTVDGVMASYGENHRMQTDDEEDAVKLENINENLAILNEGASLITDARPISKLYAPIQLRAWNLTTGTYRFEARIQGMEGDDVKAFLVDRLTGMRTPFDAGGKVASVDVRIDEDAASRAQDRFLVVIEKAAVDASMTGEAGKEQKTLTAYPNPLTGRIFHVRLQQLPAGAYTLQLIGNDGRIVSWKEIRHEGETAVYPINLDGALPKGTYLLRCLGEGSTVGNVNLVVQ